MDVIFFLNGIKPQSKTIPKLVGKNMNPFVPGPVEKTSSTFPKINDVSLGEHSEANYTKDVIFSC